LTQDKLKLQWLVNIYTHPNQIPGYASDAYMESLWSLLIKSGK